MPRHRTARDEADSPAPRPDGAIASWWRSPSVVAGAAVALTGVAFAARRRAARAEAREREFRQLADDAPDVVIRFDDQLRIRYINAAIEPHTGLRASAMIGRRVTELGLPAHNAREWDAALWQVLTERRPVMLEFAFETPHGLRYFESRFVPGVGARGAVRSIIGITRDVTERRRVEDAYRRSEAYLGEAQRLSHTGSWAWHLATGEIFWSREMFRIYGFPLADRAPPYEDVLQRAHPEDASVVDRTLKLAFRTGTDLWLLTRILVPGEPMKWVEAYGHPVRGEDGTIVEYTGTVVDVTERVLGDRRQRHAIRTRYEAVLAERMRIARDMHDGLLQDLTGIALQLGALLPHVRALPDVAARLAGVLQRAEETGRQARVTLQGMRAQSDAVELVGALEAAAWRVAAPGALSLTVRVSGEVRPVAPSVRDTAVSVVHEALTNVIKHAHARRVILEVAFSARGVRVSVRDDGRGLAVAPNGDGSGATDGHYGLVGMRERATRIGGTLSVSSAPGRGTHVRLHVAAAAEPAARAAGQAMVAVRAIPRPGRSTPGEAG